MQLYNCLGQQKTCLLRFVSIISLASKQNKRLEEFHVLFRLVRVEHSYQVERHAQPFSCVSVI